MGTTKLPSIENVFDLIERKIFVTYRTRNIDIAGKRKPRSTFAEGEEQFGRELAQAPFALDLIAVQLSVPLRKGSEPVMLSANMASPGTPASRSWFSIRHAIALIAQDWRSYALLLQNGDSRCSQFNNEGGWPCEPCVWGVGIEPVGLTSA
jgi:hypothetical protein